MRRFPSTRLVPLIALLVFASCASAPKVRVDRDASVDLSAYRTFAWLTPPSDAPKDEPAPVPSKPSQPANITKGPVVDSLHDRRVRNAVTAALEQKGYALSDANPDFRVAYTLRAIDRPKQSGMRIGLGAGGGSGNVGGGVGVSIPVGQRNETVVTLVLDIIDVRRNLQVWTGAYDAVLTGEQWNEAQDARLVNTILEKFPPRQ